MASPTLPPADEVADGLEVLLTVPEVAKMLRLSEWYVYDLARTGRLPSVRLVSRSVRFRRQDIADYIESRVFHA